MKPALFEYQAPATLREAIDLLASDPEATVIAGGQSLMPVLAYRLATASMLVDLRRVPGLGDIVVDSSGVRLGSRVRWCDIEDDQLLATAHPLLREAVSRVAHYQIRNRGTIGGSIAHADPAAELPGIAVTCEDFHRNQRQCRRRKTAGPGDIGEGGLRGAAAGDRRVSDPGSAVIVDGEREVACRV
jgi:carbon-monoxide dehydrogenase medium subunit